MGSYVTPYARKHKGKGRIGAITITIVVVLLVNCSDLLCCTVVCSCLVVLSSREPFCIPCIYTLLFGSPLNGELFEI